MNEPASVRVAHLYGQPPRQAALYWLALGTFAIYTFGWHTPHDRSARYPGEAARARAYAEEYLSDGCDVAKLKNPCRVVSIRRIGGHLWRATTSGVHFTTGNFSECIDVDVASFAVYSTGSQDSASDRFHGAVAVRC